MLVFTSDKERLLRHFRKDSALFAYHIGDLDPFHFADTQWAVIYNETAKVEDVVLTYYGGGTPVMLAFGLTDRFEELLEELLEVSPRRFHCHYQERSVRVLEKSYRLKPLGTTWRMAMKSPHLTLPESEFRIAVLDHSHEVPLKALYASSFPTSYFTPRMLETGKYVGAFDNDRIVAVAGVHFDSAEYACAAIGNVVTDREYRGRGLATQVTGRLCRMLTAERKDICLNVNSANQPAIHCYRKLGFEKACEFEEALCEAV